MTDAARTGGRRPMVALVAGSLTIAWAAVLVSLADVPPATSATYRCLYAFPVLLALTVLLRRRAAPRGGSIAGELDQQAKLLAVVAGVGSAGRLLLWHAAIAAVGAGMATVIHDVQVVLVPLAAWLLFGERLTRSQMVALPVVLLGCVLIAGVLDVGGSYGDDPLRGALCGLGAAVMYTVFQLGLKGATTRSRAPLTTLTVATGVSALATGAWGAATSTIELPAWPSAGWLLALALGVQVCGWLLITWSMLRIDVTTVSLVLLLLQPLGSMLLGAWVLDETPSAAQWVGVAMVTGGIAVAVATSGRSEPKNGQDEDRASEPGRVGHDVLTPR